MDTLIIRYKKKRTVGDLIQACIHWLEHKGILDLLIERSRHYDSLNGLIGFMMANSKGFDLINISMTWAATPEGHDYWDNICDEYNQFWKKANTLYQLQRKEFKNG